MRRSRRAASARKSPPRSATTASTTSTLPFAGSTARIRRRRIVLRWNTPLSRTWTRSLRPSALLLQSEARIMAIPITIPRIGWNMEQGVFVGWLKADGAAIRTGESLFTLESDKATEDIEGFDDGILHIPADGPRKGDVLAVGAVIGFLLQPGEPIPVAGKPAAAPPQREPLAAGTNAPATAANTPTRARPASSPRAR